MRGVGRRIEVQYLDHELLDELGPGALEEAEEQGDEDEGPVHRGTENWNSQMVQTLPGGSFEIPSGKMVVF